jgi:hypothetical protein
VAVAYADHLQSNAPLPEAICRFAREARLGAFLLDTFTKDGRTLLDWLPLERIAQMREQCRRAGLPIALAGSLGAAQIDKLRRLQPDWFAVRGAVCRRGLRDGAIEPERVSELAKLLW